MAAAAARVSSAAAIVPWRREKEREREKERKRKDLVRNGHGWKNVSGKKIGRESEKKKQERKEGKGKERQEKKNKKNKSR